MYDDDDDSKGALTFWNHKYSTDRGRQLTYNNRIPHFNNDNDDCMHARSSSSNNEWIAESELSNDPSLKRAILRIWSIAIHWYEALYLS